ncbi:MAG: DNA repair protein RadC [Nanoarchaeota archaeon]|nr:DNA repair protein RadC [Nanoarchaeota archaeon]MBU1270092.1 DNA repair protein RadC [Nanoarchaeota archaeon]MBU1603912.1 DNA repair protein RadC [Nanoarchaeota archaeon]MBU2443428.1 DNA repair protein RadC [Nanoarchaeota archaeon]
MLIKDMPIENRPRERVLSVGIESLSDNEVLSLILQKGYGTKSVIDVSNELIKKYGLNTLSELSIEELKDIKGIGLVKAISLKASFEITKRVNAGKIIGITLNNSSDVVNYYSEKLKDLKQEHFYVVFLDVRNRVMGDELISVGTLNSAVVHPREVFKEAIKRSANAIVLVHNHPSGDKEMSLEDLEVTKKMKEAGEMIGIDVVDHVVV